MAALRASLKRFAGGLLDLLFPPRCAGCRSPGTYFCVPCRNALRWQSPPACPRCGRPVSSAAAGAPCSACQRDPLPLDGIRSAVDFAGPARRAIHRFKYRADRALAPVLADIMLTAWQREPLPADMVVPEPLHAARLAARGYNQAALLGQAFAAGTGLAFAPQALARTRATTPQVTLGARQRRGNVQDAFTAQPALVAGRRVLLVDDVCTTGATLGACGAALRAAGSASVWAFTLARAVWDPELGTVDDAPS